MDKHIFLSIIISYLQIWWTNLAKSAKYMEKLFLADSDKPVGISQ
jgi:hypothetical protein